MGIPPFFSIIPHQIEKAIYWFLRNVVFCVIFSPGDVIMSKKFQGILALLAATIIWGSTFIAQSVGMDYIGPFTFLTMRAVLAVPFLIVLIFLIIFLILWLLRRCRREKNK